MNNTGNRMRTLGRPQKSGGHAAPSACRRHSRRGDRAPRLPVLLLLLLGGYAWADDWPQYRGGAGNGSSTEKGWDASAAKRLWEAKLGPGYGAVAVAGERVYAVAAVGEGNNAETVFCLAADTGKEVWRQSYAQSLGQPRSPACCTPAVVSGKVFTYGSGAVLSCFDAVTGKVNWSRDLATEIKAASTAYGYCASPIVAGGVVVVPVLLGQGRPPAAGGAYPYSGGALLGFDPATGKELWRLAEGCSPWSAPAAGMLNGKLTVVHLTGSAVIALDPTTGKRLWMYDHKEPVRDQRCYSIASSPVIAGDKVIVPTHIPQQGTLCLQVRDGKPVLLWNGPRQSWYQTPALWGELLLLPEGGASLLCADVKTGAQRWATGDLSRAPGATAMGTMPTEERPSDGPQSKGRGSGMDIHRPPGGMGGGAFTVADGQVLLLDGTGGLIVAKLTATGYEPVTRVPALERDRGNWGNQTFPVLANGRIYCRNSGGLVCFDTRRR